MFHIYIVDVFSNIKNNGLNAYVQQLGTYLKSCETEITLAYVWLNSSLANQNIEQNFENGQEHIHLPKEHSSFSPSISLLTLNFFVQHTTGKNNVIFHFNWINHASLAWQLKQNIPPVKTVLTKHCIPWRDNITSNYPLFLKLNQDFEKGLKPEPEFLPAHEETAYHSFDHIIALTACAKRSLKQFFEVQENNISVIPNGIDTQPLQLSNNRQLLRLKYGFSQREKLIIYAGKLNKRKGIIDVVKIFCDFLTQTERKDIRLLIAGSGNYEQLTGAINSHWQHVIFTGSLGKKALYELYALADIGIVPSYVEQCSYSCIEMMHSRLPLIVADVDGLKEMVNGQCGLKIKINLEEKGPHLDKEGFTSNLSLLLNHPRMAKALGDRAQKYANEHFNVVQMGQRTLSTYKELFNKSRLVEMSRSEITLIIPTWNSSEHLSRTLDSLIAQTYVNWCCIIVDDGSTDATLQIISQYADKDNRLKHVLKDKALKGANSSRNFGLLHAKSEFVMFLDADDVLLPECLQRRAVSIDKYRHADLLIFKTALMNDFEYLTGHFPCAKKTVAELILNFIEHQIQWQTMSVVWKKDFLDEIGGWNEDFERLQDVELNIRALIKKPKLVFSNLPFDSKYRHMPLTPEKKKAALFGFIRLIKTHYNTLVKGPNFDAEWKDKFAYAFVKLIYSTLKSYLTLEEANKEWERFLLNTLQHIAFDNNKYLKIKEVLEELHE